MTTAFRCWGFCLIALTCGLARSAETSDAGFSRTPEATRARLKRDSDYLASEALEGRGVRTTGLDQAAEYVAEEFRRAGLKTDHYQGRPFQEFKLFSAGTKSVIQSLKFRRDDGTEDALKADRDFASLVANSSKTFSGSVVFAGYGITDKNLGYDDFAGIDVRGKVVIVLRHEPQRHLTSSVFDGLNNTPHAFIGTKVDTAQSHGAIAVLVCTDAAEHPGVSPADWPAEELLKVDLKTGLGVDNIPVAHVRRSFVEAWIRGSLGRSLADIERSIDETLRPHSAELTGCRLSGDIAITRSGRTLKNVVATLPATGRQADEAIVIGAHYDHLGRGGWGSLAVDNADEIHNGADDNASGTAVLLEAARILAARGTPRHRQLIFIGFSGEELGLFGSKRYCQSPLVPMTKTVAMINLDMVGRLRKTLEVYGTGTAAEWPRWLNELGPKHDIDMEFEPSGFGPSDHATFHERGVPVLHFFTGFHPDYHRPSDDADRLNIDGMVRIAGLLVDLVEILDQAEQRPRAKSSEESTMIAESGNLSGLLVGPSTTDSGKLDVTLSPRPNEPGLLLERLDPRGAAARAGLRVGDVLLRAEGQPITTAPEFAQQYERLRPGEQLRLEFARGGITRTTPLVRGR